MRQGYRCWAEVDLAALRNNLAWIRGRVGPDVKIMTVVKADAYGHGLNQIAGALMASGAQYFGVANLAEAQTVRRVGAGWPVLILGPCLPQEIGPAVRDNISVTISSIREAEAFSAAARHQRKTVTVHVKIDTGMGRIGIPPHQTLSLVRAIRPLPGIDLEGLFTHLASAEDDPQFSRRQLDQFRQVIQELRAESMLPPLVHASNSATLLHEPEIFTLIRPGLMVYGILPAGKRPMQDSLASQIHPALALKCRVGFIKEIAPGTPLSYGQSFVANRNTRVATLTAGYGDGYMRAGSNRALVLIGGRRCRILGRITMDQMLADISALPQVEIGAEAVLIGAQDNEQITASEVAQWCHSIPWEILTAISYRVPRLYLGAHAA